MGHEVGPKHLLLHAIVKSSLIGIESTANEAAPEEDKEEGGR